MAYYTLKATLLDQAPLDLTKELFEKDEETAVPVLDCGIVDLTGVAGPEKKKALDIDAEENEEQKEGEEMEVAEVKKVLDIDAEEVEEEKEEEKQDSSVEVASQSVTSESVDTETSELSVASDELSKTEEPTLSKSTVSGSEMSESVTEPLLTSAASEPTVERSVVTTPIEPHTSPADSTPSQISPPTPVDVKRPPHDVTTESAEADSNGATTTEIEREVEGRVVSAPDAVEASVDESSPEVPLDVRKPPHDEVTNGSVLSEELQAEPELLPESGHQSVVDVDVVIVTSQGSGESLEDEVEDTVEVEVEVVEEVSVPFETLEVKQRRLTSAEMLSTGGQN
eukprot:gene31189-38538_t